MCRIVKLSLGSLLALVGGMLPPLLQLPLPAQVVEDPKTSTLLLGLFSLPLVIIVRATLYRHSSSDLFKVMSILSHYPTAAYVILGTIIRLQI